MFTMKALKEIRKFMFKLFKVAEDIITKTVSKVMHTINENLNDEEIKKSQSTIEKTSKTIGVTASLILTTIVGYIIMHLPIVISFLRIAVMLDTISLIFVMVKSIVNLTETC